MPSEGFTRLLITMGIGDGRLELFELVTVIILFTSEQDIPVKPEHDTLV